MTETMTVEIPADVKDNSETVTDYAFRRDLSTNRDYHRVAERDQAIDLANRLRGMMHRTVYTWYDENPDRQRCRFDMVVDWERWVLHLFHTEYFTRVACAECAYSYASVYQVIQTEDGTSDAVPRCDEHADRFRRALVGEAVTLHESERLRIGQHD